MSNDEARARELRSSLDACGYHRVFDALCAGVKAEDWMHAGKSALNVSVERFIHKLTGVSRDEAAALQSASPGAADAGGEVERCWQAVKLELGHLFRDGAGGDYREIVDLDRAIASIAPASEDGWRIGYNAAIQVLREWADNFLSSDTNATLRAAANDLERNRDTIIANLSARTGKGAE